MPETTVALLGPLRVTVDGAPVEVPGRGERALLSLLALDAGRRVSVQRLVEALWEEDLPSNPTNALQLRVSKLRRAVGDLVVTEPSGYRLDLPGSSIDVHRFRELVARSRPHEALALWRGTPLDEFAGRRWADIEVTALQQERVHALTDRVDADLARGRHHELVGELERLLEEHPANERLWSQLMLAQYRSDRPAEALATYQRARAVLAEQFGLDPGPQLRQMEQAILRRAPTLEPAATRVARAPVGSFVGRADDLERSLTALRSHRLVTVVGPGGVGKTRLALEAANHLGDEYDDGAVVVDLEDVGDSARVAAALAAAVGTDHTSGAEGEALANWFRRRACLLVLDGCEKVATAAAALVGDLLAAAPRLTVLATSRVTLGVAGGIDLRLGPLPQPTAIELFLARVDEVDGAGDDAEGATVARDQRRAAASAIVDRVDRLPLAIELAAAWTRSLSVEEVANRLADDLSLLDHTTGPSPARRTLHDVVARSLDLLAPAEEVLFRQLAVFRGGWSLEDAEAVCVDEQAPDPIVVTLARLVEKSLVVTDRGRYRLLAPLAEVAADRLAAAGEQDAVRQAHATHFLGLARAAEERLRGPDQSQWLTRLRASTANMTAALAWAREEHGDVTDELLLAAAGLGWFWFLGRHGDGRRELAAALAAAGDGAAAAPRTHGRALQAQSIVRRPGGCLVHPDAEADALAAASRDLLATAGDGRRALLSAVMADVRAIGGVDTTGALERLATAAVRFRDEDDGWGAALADFVAMEIHVQQGDIEEAVVLGERARGGFEQAADAWGTSSVALHLAHGLRLAGRHDEALALLEVGQADADRADIRNTLCGIHVDLARLALHRGDVAATRRSVHRVRSLAQDLGNRMLLGMAAVVEAALQLDRDRPDDARRLLHVAIDRFEDEGVPGGLAEALCLCAVADVDRGDLGAAERHARQAQELAMTMHDRGLQAQALEALALAAAVRGAHTDAATTLGRAAFVRREGGRPASRTEQAVVDRAATPARRALGAQRFDELVEAATTATS